MGTLISGIGLTCFAASYGVAWVLEVLKLFSQSGARQILMLGFVLAGLLAHTLYLGYRAVEFSASPLSSSFDWCLVAAWLLMGTYLYLLYYYPRAALGLYMLPLVLALVAAAAFADATPFEPGPASRVWGAVHGIFLLLGTVAVMVGFAAGLVYLVQAHRLKRKLPPMPGFRLPSLEWLEKVNSRVIIFSALMVAIGFMAGMILNIVDRGQTGELPWSDPVIWSSALMLCWLVAAAVFNAVYRPARRGRKVAYLTVVSFLFLVVALGVLLLVDTRHGGQKRHAPTGTAHRTVDPAPVIRSNSGWVPCSRLREHGRIPSGCAILSCFVAIGLHLSCRRCPCDSHAHVSVSMAPQDFNECRAAANLGGRP